MFPFSLYLSFFLTFLIYLFVLPLYIFSVSVPLPYSAVYFFLFMSSMDLFFTLISYMCLVFPIYSPMYLFFHLPLACSFFLIILSSYLFFLVIPSVFFSIFTCFFHISSVCLPCIYFPPYVYLFSLSYYPYVYSAYTYSVFIFFLNSPIRLLFLFIPPTCFLPPYAIYLQFIPSSVLFMFILPPYASPVFFFTFYFLLVIRLVSSCVFFLYLNNY